MTESTPYAEPPAKRPELEECSFYHFMELPGLGLQTGQWDLRPGIEAYLGRVDYAGSRVLEIGTADGYVCFELERRGAEVVAVDLPAGTIYDARPQAEALAGSEWAEAGLERIRNAYWLAHALFDSTARVVYAHANDLPSGLGRFDVAFLGNVLPHVRDPAGVLLAAARLADTVVVTEADWMPGVHDDLAGLIFFTGAHPHSWFQVKPPFLVSLLGEMGLDDVHVDRHEQLRYDDVDFERDPRIVREFSGAPVPHFTVTARSS